MNKIIYIVAPYILSFISFMFYYKIRAKTELMYRYWAPVYLFIAVLGLFIAVGITLLELNIIR
jgi:hypothetical protein